MPWWFSISPLNVMTPPVSAQPFVRVWRRGRAAGGVNKPVLACIMSSHLLRDEPLHTTAETIPVYTFPEQAAKVLSKCAEYAEWRAQTPGVIQDYDDIQVEIAREVVRQAVHTRGEGWLSADEVSSILDAFGIPHPAGGTARTGKEAAALAEKIGFPVAVKLASLRIVHKSETGGVRLNLNDRIAVEHAFDDICSQLEARNELHLMDGVTVQPMISGGVELMIGVTEDPLFGPIVAFGLGGVHVEILRDVQFRITPLTDKDASAMIREIRGSAYCRVTEDIPRPMCKPWRTCCSGSPAWSRKCRKLPNSILIP